MKRVFALFCAAFPSIVLLAQTSPAERPAVGMSSTGMASVERLSAFPKRFPPEMMAGSRTTAGKNVKLSRSYCVHPNADRKSLSFKRCEPVPVRLISPFASTAPKKGLSR